MRLSCILGQYSFGFFNVSFYWIKNNIVVPPPFHFRGMHCYVIAGGNLYLYSSEIELCQYLYICNLHICMYLTVITENHIEVRGSCRKMI